WTDFNNDKWPDLIVVGDWMAIHIFKNEKGRLVRWSDHSLAETDGLWKRVVPIDIDQDGDMDYVVGNAGENLPWTPSSQNPVQIRIADFNTDGRIDPVFTQFEKGREIPMASRDELLNQLPLLKKTFTSYRKYAEASLPDLINKTSLLHAKTLTLKKISSAILLNLGKAGFKLSDLPISAQFSSAYGLLVYDFNRDGWQDVLVGGNFRDYKTNFGPNDASMGTVLLNDRKGGFLSQNKLRFGKILNGEVRHLEKLGTANQSYLLIVGSNQAVRLAKIM
ncbi:MAG: FG-GAP repeat domain-containing protein, partial [Cytophagales bacterium]